MTVMSKLESTLGAALLWIVAAAPGAAQNRPRAVQAMSLAPVGWDDGGRIPVKNTQPGRDVSPARSWTDAATGNGTDDLLHWMVRNIPAGATSLPAGIPTGANRPDGSRQISASGPYYRGRASIVGLFRRAAP